jgi:uncharacterized protein (DUF1697 family)
MPTYVALLRGINVTGANKLLMSDLVRLCEAAGYTGVRTFIASGNAVFTAPAQEAEVRASLEARLAALAGKPIGVHVRSGAEMASVRDGNPWPQAPANHVMAIFLDGPVTPSVLDGVKNQAPNELLSVGKRVLYVWYGSGQGKSKLRIPAAKWGTARNMNTVAKLAAMSADEHQE